MRIVQSLVLGGLMSWIPVFAAPAHPAEEKTLTVDGLERSYLLVCPPNTAGPLPLVLVFHGGGGHARQMERYSRFNDLALAEKFVVVYPEGIGGNWNDGRGVRVIRAQRENVDDVKFVRALVDDVAKHCPIDRSRVFATGISNGAFISHRLAAEASDLIAAIAPVVGSMSPQTAEKFTPEFPVSILIIQGDADPLIPFEGGPVAANLGPGRGIAMSTPKTLALYVKRNGNPCQPAISIQDKEPDDETSLEIQKYADGPGGVKTELYLVKGGGHTWPGRPLYLPQRTIGRASQEFSATDAIWAFFKTCPPRKSPSK
jgi:polyhydroxybutyrate depolymerase